MSMGFVLTIDGVDAMIRQVDRSLQFSVINKSLKEGVSILAGWSVKYRMSGKRPKYIDKVSGFLTGSILDSVKVARTHKTGTNYYMDYGSDMPYAATHEYGRGNIPARPYLRPSLENDRNKRLIEKTFAKNIQRALNHNARR